MTKPEIDVSGAWYSSHDYDDGRHSEHTVDLRQNGLMVNGSSRPKPFSSEVFFELLLLPPQETEETWLLNGRWKEQTARNGEYGGMLFHGVVQLALNQLANVANGKLIGHNRDRRPVPGSLILKRYVE